MNKADIPIDFMMPPSRRALIFAITKIRSEAEFDIHRSRAFQATCQLQSLAARQSVLADNVLRTRSAATQGPGTKQRACLPAQSEGGDGDQPSSSPGKTPPVQERAVPSTISRCV